MSALSSCCVTLTGFGSTRERVTPGGEARDRSPSETSEELTSSVYSEDSAVYFDADGNGLSDDEGGDMDDPDVAPLRAAISVKKHTPPVTSTYVEQKVGSNSALQAGSQTSTVSPATSTSTLNVSSSSQLPKKLLHPKPPSHPLPPLPPKAKQKQPLQSSSLAIVSTPTETASQGPSPVPSPTVSPSTATALPPEELAPGDPRLLIKDLDTGHVYTLKDVDTIIPSPSKKPAETSTEKEPGIFKQISGLTKRPSIVGDLANLVNWPAQWPSSFPASFPWQKSKYPGFSAAVLVESFSPSNVEVSSSVVALEWNNNGRYLATAGQEGVVRILERLPIPKIPTSDSEEGTFFQREPKRVLHGHTDGIVAVSWSSSDYLATCSMDKDVKVWHVDSDDCFATFSHPDIVTSVAFSPTNENQLITSSLDNKLRLWNTTDQRMTAVEMEEYITATTITPDGKIAIAGSYEGNIYFCDITQGLKTVYTLKVLSFRGKRSGEGKRKVTGLKCFSESSAPKSPYFLLVTCADSRIRLYRDNAHGEFDLTFKYKGFSNTKYHISASASDTGTFIVCGSDDKWVHVWTRLPEVLVPSSTESPSKITCPSSTASQSKGQLLSNATGLSRTSEYIKVAAGGPIVAATFAPKPKGIGTNWTVYPEGTFIVCMNTKGVISVLANPNFVNIPHTTPATAPAQAPPVIPASIPAPIPSTSQIVPAASVKDTATLTSQTNISCTSPTPDVSPVTPPSTS